MNAGMVVTGEDAEPPLIEGTLEDQAKQYSFEVKASLTKISRQTSLAGNTDMCCHCLRT